MVCTGVLVGMGIPVGIPEGIPVSMDPRGHGHPSRHGHPGEDGQLLAGVGISTAAFALLELQLQHPQCRVGHRGMKSPPTGCMLKAPSSAKTLPKMLPSSTAPWITAV